jgi:hypothetical protein
MTGGVEEGGGRPNRLIKLRLQLNHLLISLSASLPLFLLLSFSAFSLSFFLSQLVFPPSIQFFTVFPPVLYHHFFPFISFLFITTFARDASMTCTLLYSTYSQFSVLLYKERMFII